MMPVIKISPFDLKASTYDQDFTQSKIGVMQRRIVWEILTPLLTSRSGPLNILEINCGTGEDALHLAKLGHQVTATDASQQMIERASQKLRINEPANNKPNFITCSFDQIGKMHFEKKFDLVISNFGGLNCIDDHGIVALSNHLAKLTTNHGQLLLVVLSKFCLWEVLYYSMKGNFGSAFRRLKRSVPFNIGKHTMNIYYYSPHQLSALFRDSFNFFKLKPVGLLIPPSYLEPGFLKRPRLLQLLNSLEKKFGLPGFSFLADHYCVILNKNKS